MEKEKREQAAAIAFDSAGHPDLLASGSGAIARQIVEMAFALGIPVREDPNLTQILSALEPQSAIPPAALAPLAEILNHLYRANCKMAGDTP